MELVLIICFLFIGFILYGISYAIRKGLVEVENRYAKAIRTSSFLLIFFAIFLAFCLNFLEGSGHRPMEWFILLIAFLLISLASYGISNVIHKRAVKAGNSYARAFRIGSFVLSFLLILFGIILLMLYNFTPER